MSSIEIRTLDDEPIIVKFIPDNFIKITISELDEALTSRLSSSEALKLADFIIEKFRK
jgi:hypothetical protein